MNRKNSNTILQEITAAAWDEKLASSLRGDLLMYSDWEREIEAALPFVRFQHLSYGDSHLLRIAHTGERYTTAPFYGGSDVISLNGTPLDLEEFAADMRRQFGESLRLRVGERFAPVLKENSVQLVAHEHIVSLDRPILPRVRKTLRHILSRPCAGLIGVTDAPEDISASYDLYLRHMRSVRNFAMPRRLFEALTRSAGAELWVWRREAGEKARAFAVFLRSEKEVLYSLSAADRAAFEQRAPHHLVYAALEASKKGGAMQVSLGATGIASSLEVFKRGWRGEEYRIFEIGARTFSAKKRSKVRELAGFVPLPLYPLLTEKVGKHLL